MRELLLKACMFSLCNLLIFTSVHLYGVSCACEILLHVISYKELELGSPLLVLPPFTMNIFFHKYNEIGRGLPY
jgi:hypothetical protein